MKPSAKNKSISSALYAVSITFALSPLPNNPCLLYKVL